MAYLQRQYFSGYALETRESFESAQVEAAIRSFIETYKDKLESYRIKLEPPMAKMPQSRLSYKEWSQIEALMLAKGNGISLSKVIESGYPGDKDTSNFKQLLNEYFGEAAFTVPVLDDFDARTQSKIDD